MGEILHVVVHLRGPGGGGGDNTVDMCGKKDSRGLDVLELEHTRGRCGRAGKPDEDALLLLLRV